MVTTVANMVMASRKLAEIKKERRAQFVAKLYELRLKYYPQAIHATESLRRRSLENMQSAEDLRPCTRALED